MSNAIMVEESGEHMVVRFNRPEIRSPLSIDVLEQLMVIVEVTRKRLNIHGLVFTGVGDVFASGADLREIAEVDSKAAADFAERGQRLMRMIEDLPMASVAAVNGICYGGALDLALACQRRIASPRARFSHPGANLGIMTGWGGTQRLPRLVGQAVALEIFFTAKSVDAAEALRLGLVDEIADDPVERALET